MRPVAEAGIKLNLRTLLHKCEESFSENQKQPSGVDARTNLYDPVSPMKPIAMTTTLPHLGLSSMGCPEATLEDILQLAESFCLDYVELRSLGGSTDLPAYLRNTPAPGPDRPQVRLLATPLCLLKATPEAVEEFYRFAELANRFHTLYLRVFGDGGSTLGEDIDEALLTKVAETLDTLRARMRERGWTAEILLETHDIFSSADRCLALNALLDQPVKILWDSFHTWNLGGESPWETWDKIEPWIKHIHHADSYSPRGTAHAAESKFAPTGQGNYPCEELLALLKEKRFDGGLTLEWEKLWFPELPHVKEVLGDFVRMFRGEQAR